MVYSQFKDTVLSFLNRAGSAVVTTANTDLVLIAMNDARRWAQREYTFEQNATQAFVYLSMLGKSLLTDFRTTPSSASGTVVVVVKRIDALFEYATTTISSTTVYYPTLGIELRRRMAIAAHVPSEPLATALSSPTLGTFAYLQGQKLYHTNLTIPTWVFADVIEFLPDHAGGTTEDIFLKYYTDWLRVATLASLNVWLKDNERTPIDQALLGGLWNSVKQFDAQQAVSTDDLSLD